MSAGYRDELDAALAAKESLQAQNNELHTQLNQTQNALGQAQNTIAQQQAMLQQYGIQAPTSRGAKPGAAIAIIVGIAGLLVIMGAGVAFFMVSRSQVESTPPSYPRTEPIQTESPQSTPPSVPIPPVAPTATPQN